MKPKLVLKVTSREVLRCLRSPLSPKDSESLPFRILKRLVLDRKENLGSLYEPLLRVCEERNISDYFRLQQHNSPTEYEGWLQYSEAAVALSFLKKYPFGKVDFLDPLKTALNRFDEAERLCRTANKRLRWFRNRGFRLDRKHKDMHGILHHARLIVDTILGPLDLNTIYDYTRFGPGGALGVTGTKTTAFYKYAAQSYTVSPRAKPYAEAAILADPLWRRYVVAGDSIIGDDVPSIEDARESVRSRLRITNYNKVTFVPKTAQTHRAIAIEPFMNIFLQLGVGDFMTTKLRRHGIDLQDQTRNQSLAKLGSLNALDCGDRPVTLDLSMASDTLPYELVRDLLSTEWFDFLCDIRSEYGEYGDKKFHWAKFSSMGNGFTFPLETLIFFALCLAVRSKSGARRDLISVYGDDIIVPGSMALMLCEVLTYCGFRLNTEKSYFFGPFRESCGADWFEGRDVRPFFLKKKIKTCRDLIFIHNNFHVTNCFSRVANDNSVRFITGRIPSIVRDNLLGPITTDLEGHLFSPWDAAQKSRFILWDREVQSWTYKSCRASPIEFDGDAGPIYLQMIGTVSSDEVDFSEPPFKVGLALSQQLARWVALTDTAEIKSSAVTRRKSTRFSLSTSSCKGWRNDRHLAWLNI